MSTVNKAIFILTALALFIGACNRSIDDDHITEILNSWGKTTDIPPEFFYADDVTLEVQTGFEQAFRAATDEWGNYGPLEWWIVGSNLSDAQALLEIYCTRRDGRGDESLKDCMEYSTQATDFLEWADKAAEVVDSGKPWSNAGRQGYAHWGIHLFSSSLPLSWAGVANVPVEDDQYVLFHEYFHAVQHAHLLPEWPRNWEQRKSRLGPVWFMEGSADFMGIMTTKKLRDSGKLPSETRDLGWKWDSNQEMIKKMEMGLKGLEENPQLRLADIPYGPDKKIAYDLGAWAIAYLCDASGPNVLLDEFYPKLNELGWEGAFVDTFGISSEEFYVVFDKFLALPTHEQLKILP